MKYKSHSAIISSSKKTVSKTIDRTRNIKEHYFYYRLPRLETIKAENNHFRVSLSNFSVLT